MRKQAPPTEAGKRAPSLFDGYHFRVKPSWSEGYYSFYVLRGETCLWSEHHCATEEEAITKAKADIAKREAADAKKVRR